MTLRDHPRGIYYTTSIIVKGPHVLSSGTLSSRHLCEGHLPLTGKRARQV